MDSNASPWMRVNALLCRRQLQHRVCLALCCRRRPHHRQIRRHTPTPASCAPPPSHSPCGATCIARSAGGAPLSLPHTPSNRAQCHPIRVDGEREAQIAPSLVFWHDFCPHFVKPRQTAACGAL
eukprot:2947547-Pleurochrysis_carterae.AAC.2